jgi:cytochrome P450
LRIAQGDRVILRVASANRDPQQFPDPDRIDFSRRGPAHLALGFGPHSCAGAALIRMGVKVATRLFVKNFADAEICSAVEWQGGTGFRCPARLVVRQPRTGNRDNTFTSSLQPQEPRSV